MTVNSMRRLQRPAASCRDLRSNPDMSRNRCWFSGSSAHSLRSNRHAPEPAFTAVFEPVRAIRRKLAFDSGSGLLKLLVCQHSLPASVGALVHKRLPTASKDFISLGHDLRAEILFHTPERNSLEYSR